MASEKARRMQDAARLEEILASLDRIEIALGLKPKPAEVKEPEAKAAEPAPAQSPLVEETPPGAATLQGQRQVTASRQNPARGQR